MKTVEKIIIGLVASSSIGALLVAVAMMLNMLSFPDHITESVIDASIIFFKGGILFFIALALLGVAFIVWAFINSRKGKED